MNDHPTRPPLDWDGRCYTQRIATVLHEMFLVSTESPPTSESAETSSIWKSGAKENPNFGSYYFVAYSAAARVLGYDLEVSRDVALDAMLMFHEKYLKAKLYDPSKGKETTLLFAIAFNMALSAKRRLLKEQSIRVYIDLATVPEPDREIVLARPSERFNRAVRKAWTDALKTLTEPQRQVMTLYVDKGFSLKKIAEVLGIKKDGTVRARAHRARLRLRKNRPLMQLAAKLLAPVGGEF